MIYYQGASVAIGDAVQAFFMSGEVGFTDIINFGLGAAGGVLNIVDAHLKAERTALMAGKASKASASQIKIINKSIKGLGKTAKYLGITGLLISGSKATYDYFGDDVTASQTFDLVVTGILTFATVTNPALLVGFGAYALLDAAGAFDGIKESLGGIQ